MDGMLRGLNEAQRSAVTSSAAVLQVLAPPGSGKTKTLTSRVGYLIANHGLEPRNIIVCTFTVKAAREMEERIAGFLGKDVAGKLLLGTFHSISRRYLAAYGKKIDLDEHFGIADSSDTMSILTRIIKRVGVSIAPAKARARISALKSQGLNAEQFASSSKKADQQEIAIIFTEYEDHLRVSKLLDFDDLLLRCVELLRRFPSCVANVEAVLIDEFQDTNNIQYDLMQLFAQSRQAITIVGDPDQSIYGWRNAEIRNLKKMQQQYPDTCVVKLEENYRSSGAILLSAQEVIEQDLSRPSKRLLPTHSVGMLPVLRKLPNAATEATWIVSEIQRSMALTGGLLNYSDYAILLRSASLSRHIEHALGKEGIPYRMVGGHKFFDRLEVKLVLDYLRVLNHPDHNDALARILNVPPRKVGDVTIQRLLEEADEKKLPLWTLILGIAQGRIRQKSQLSSQSLKGLEIFINLMLTAQKRLKDSTTHDLALDEFLVHVIYKINLEEYLKRTKAEEFESRWSNVQELIAQAADFSVTAAQQQSHELSDETGSLQDTEKSQTMTTEHVLSGFLANIALSTEAQKGDKDQDNNRQVTISTIHAAKGLEWPVVFIPAVYAGSIPHSRAEDTDEERRLLFVAMTRAQSLLYLSIPKKNSTRENTTLSPFLSEKPMESYFDKKGPAFNMTVAVELAGILRRQTPNKKAIEQALLTLEFVRDDRWSLGGDDDDNDDYGNENKPILWDGEKEYASSRDLHPKGTTSGRSPAYFQGNNRTYEQGRMGVSLASSTMHNHRGFSISSATFSTTFMSAARAMTTMNQAEMNAADARKANPLQNVTGVSKKRKMEESDGRATAQQTLKGFFANASSKPIHPAHGNQALLEADPSQNRRGKPLPNPPPLEQEATSSRLYEASGYQSSGQHRALTTSQAGDPSHTPSMHVTSVQLANNRVPRKTLGVRRSMNGWAERHGKGSESYKNA